MDESKKPGRHFGLGLGRLLGGGEDPPDASADEPSDDDETPKTDPALHDSPDELPDEPLLSDDGDDPSLRMVEADDAALAHPDPFAGPDATADAVATAPDDEEGDAAELKDAIAELEDSIAKLGDSQVKLWDSQVKLWDAITKPGEEPLDGADATPEEDSEQDGDTPPDGVEPDSDDQREEDDMTDEESFISDTEGGKTAPPQPAVTVVGPPGDVAVAEAPADAGEAAAPPAGAGATAGGPPDLPANRTAGAPEATDPLAAYRDWPAPAQYRTQRAPDAYRLK